MTTWRTSDRVAITLGLGALLAVLPACGWPYGYDRDLPDAGADPPADLVDGEDSPEEPDGADTAGEPDGEDPGPDVGPDGGLALVEGGVRVIGGSALTSGGLTLRQAGMGTTGPVCSGTLCVSGGIQP